jgi:DNA-binding transcriptional regulator YdaS (Cro superfamily)
MWQGEVQAVLFPSPAVLYQLGSGEAKIAANMAAQIASACDRYF